MRHDSLWGTKDRSMNFGPGNSGGRGGGGGSDSDKSNQDNHSNQMNPNNDAYWSSRGTGKPDDDEED